jgi:hypothetical protein
MKSSLLAACLCVIPAALFSQEFRGTISGTISDPTGAMIANVKVTVTETHTGTKVPTVSDSGGHYTVPFLLPGDYDIAAQIEGFKGFVRKAVHLGSGDHPVIDIRLDVGDMTQSIEVTADAAQLNTENASTGQSITTKEVEELPLNGRTPLMLASLSLGVTGIGQPGLIHPYDAAGAAGWSIGGAYAQTSELLIDGSPNASWDGRQAYSPPQDAVQEVRIKAFDTDAAFGHTAGGTLNQVLKSGSNGLHGSLYEFVQPYNLTANDFFQNKQGQPRQLTHLNQYGLTAGGPIYVPKVVDTRNRVFWFFAWDNMKDSQPVGASLTVPTAAEAKGDFSQVLAADGPSSQLYDPFSATLNGTTITRSAYPNNVIPTSQLNPVAQNYLKYYSAPNSVPVRPDGFQNFTNNSPTIDGYDNEFGRMDFNISGKNRMFFNARHSFYSGSKNNYFRNTADGSTNHRNDSGASIDDVHMLSPSAVLNVRLNFTRMNEYHTVQSTGFDPTTLGFPTYMKDQSYYLEMPIVSFSTFTTLGNSGTGADTLPSQSVQLFSDVIKTHGNHTLKFGGDVRQYRLNTFTAGNGAGTFSFSGNSWVRQASTSSATVAMGQDLATFLLGLPTSGSYDQNTSGSWYSVYFAGFVQDDWRIKPNLTLNLGVRFDHDGPYNEKYGRTVNGFDTTSQSPLAAAAVAAYAKTPLAQLPAGAFNVLGGLTYPGAGGTAIYKNNSHLVSPRFGFAWTPDQLKGKTVIRGGLGMFVSAVVPSRMNNDNSYSSSPILNQQGFSQTTSMTVTGDNFRTPATTLSNPFPAGFQPAPGSSAGLLTFAGQAVAFLNPVMKNPYSMRWNFGIQQAISKDTMLEVVYIGNHALHSPVYSTQLNGIPRQFLSTLPFRDPAQTYLSGTATNPFSGLKTTQNTASTTAAQLLARYPQFPVGDSATGFNGSGGVLEQDLDIGSSYFESLNVRVQKRLSKGLSVTVNYIYSKLEERGSWLNASDPMMEKRVSPSDRPQRLTASLSYELPFGKGKLLNLQSRWANALAGGWHFNGILTRQAGAPIIWNNGSTTSPGDYVYFGAPLTLDSRQVNTVAFNTAAFDTKAADAFNYHIRTFPTTFGNLRMDGINQVDASMLKRFNVAERKYFEFRFEAFNALNHPVFASPNITASNSGFGTITAVANKPRSAQLGCRFVF